MAPTKQSIASRRYYVTYFSTEIMLMIMTTMNYSCYFHFITIHISKWKKYHSKEGKVVPVLYSHKKWPGTHWIGDWVGVRAGIDNMEN
jgi:hypothetical protein